MRPYIKDYIFTLSRQRQEKVTDLLEEARLGKEQLNGLVERLNESLGSFTPLILAKETPNRGITGDAIASNIRDISLRLRDLFDASNTISLLLDSHEALLGSDVKAIEDELLALEKMALNYSFLMSDAQAYSYAHLEPFSDERWRETRDSVPDRAGLSFSASESAVVQADEGVLALPNEPPSNLGLRATILKSNANAFVVTDTGIDNVSTRTANGWKMTVATAGPVTSSLPESNETGAQVLTEFTLSPAAPLSQIKLVPFADMSIRLVQATIYPDADDSKGIDLLTLGRTVDRPITLHFPMQSVARFRLILNQPTYVRVTRTEKVEEFRYKKIVDDIRAKKRSFRQEYRPSSHIQRLERAVRQRKFGDMSSLSIPTTFISAYRWPVTPERLATITTHRNAEWRNVSDKASLMYSLLSKSDTELKDIDRNTGDQVLRSQAVQTLVAPDNNNSIGEPGFNYYYTLGLLYVSAGSNVPSFKGVFVSKPLPSSSDIGEVKIKTSEDNYEIAYSDRSSNLVTSVEYSVSNTADPANEEDWTPILPIDVSRVLGERFLPDPNGNGYLRFMANLSEGLVVYKNGYVMEILPEYYITHPKDNGVVGLKIPQNQMSSADIFTCDYTPLDDPYTVSFATRGFSEVPLVSAYNEDGAGEVFGLTSERNTVSLSYIPYIDPVSSLVAGYEPIIVKLNSGDIATNLTDYTNQTSPTLPSTGYYYIQSGNTLMFNVPILEPFKVFYQYLQNNVRVRVVLRCNSKDFVSPKVDYFHLKAKTRKADTNRL